MNAAVAAAGGKAFALFVVGDGVDVLALRKLAETFARLQIPNSRLAVPIAGGDMNSTPESAVQSNVRAGGLRDSWTECARGDGFEVLEGMPSPDAATSRR